MIAAIHSRHAAVLNETILALGLPYHVILNKNSAMVLPSGVDKGTGVVAVLESMGVATKETVAVETAKTMKICFESQAFGWPSPMLSPS